MTAYVVLEFDDNLDAADLYYEMAADPERPIKTPMGHAVRARVVYHGTANPIRDECDTRGEGGDIGDSIRRGVSDAEAGRAQRMDWVTEGVEEG